MTPPDANASQRLAALPDHSAWVEANAGSGKTKVLIDRVARLLLAGAEPDSILCVTYTNAAASEMQGRLFERLGAWCVMPREALAYELAALQSEKPDPSALDDAFIGRARELFARALETPGGLRIETIHAFCGRVLRRFPLEAGAAPGFTELDDAEAGDLMGAAQAGLGASVRAGDARLGAAVQAAARTGRISAALEAVRAHRPEIERFLKRFPADGRAEAELQRLLAAPPETVEALLEAGLGADLPRAALQRAADAFEDSDQGEILRFVLSDAAAEDRLDAYRSLFLTKDGKLKAQKNVVKAALQKNFPFLMDLFSVDVPQGGETRRVLALDEAIRARRILDASVALIQLADALFRVYAEAKRSRAALDFDDLIDLVGALLSNPAAGDWVLWKLDGGVAHILIDEAQDTSPRQWEILNRLGADIFAGQGADRARPRTWFVVGDQKQSIYSFQGADPEHFLLETQGFVRRAESGAVPHVMPVLAASFRSTPEVLRFVDKAFDPEGFEDRAPFSLRPPVDADQTRHVAHRSVEPGSVELWPLETATEKVDPDPWDAPRIQEAEPGPRARLAANVAAFIRRDIDARAAVWDRGLRRPSQPGDYLILVRSRGGGLFDALLRSLKRLGLPVAGADRIRLLDSLAVQDLLNLMRFVQHVDDDLVLAEILKGPFGGFNDDDLVALAATRPGSLWRALQEAGDPFREIHQNLADMLAHRGLAPGDFLLRHLERPIAGGPPGWERILSRFGAPAREPVTALLDRAAAFGATSTPSIELFLRSVEQRGGEVKRELSGTSDTVRVMTVHGAKGLEAPVVILPDTTREVRKDTAGVLLAESGAPFWVGGSKGDSEATAKVRTLSQARELREHRRLLYVALTRARDRLVICGAAHGRSGEGFDQNSWYALCQRAMNRLREKALVTDPDEAGVVRLGAPAPALDGAGAAPGATSGLPAWLGAPTPQETSTARILAPSNLSGNEPPVLPPFGAERRIRLRRGRIIHRLLQVLPAVAPERRMEAADRLLGAHADVSAAERADMREAALGLLAHPDFQPLFGPGGRSEAPVIGRLGSDIINGRVDRLAITDTEVLVIDYKTDRPAPADVSGVGQAYLRQMAAYRAILAEAWPGRRVRCLLAWTDGPILMELPEAILEAALEGLR